MSYNLRDEEVMEGFRFRRKGLNNNEPLVSRGAADRKSDEESSTELITPAHPFPVRPLSVGQSPPRITRDIDPCVMFNPRGLCHHESAIDTSILLSAKLVKTRCHAISLANSLRTGLAFKSH